MALYNCDCCKYSTTVKYNYKLHLQTKKHLINSNNQLKNDSGKHSSNDTENNNEINKRICEFCNKTYSCKQSLYIHKKKCKEINNSSTNTKNTTNYITNNNITNNNITNNITNNIIINNYSNTDLSFLNDELFIKAIKGVNYSVIDFIKYIHFNPDKKENMNIQLNNVKGNFLNVYENGKWLARFNEIDNIYEKYEAIIDEWNDNEGDKYPISREKYLRYVKNKPEIFKRLKQHTIEMLYNNTLIHFK